MKYILLFLPFLIGCNSADVIVKTAYEALCERQPDSMSCMKHEDIGNEPGFQYIVGINYEALENFTYMTDEQQHGVEEYWLDNKVTSTKLKGDCDDISLTFASQLIMDGVKPSSIRLVASGIKGELKHYYINVRLDDGTDFKFYHIKEYTDIMYMQYDQVGTFVKL